MGLCLLYPVLLVPVMSRNWMNFKNLMGSDAKPAKWYKDPVVHVFLYGLGSKAGLTSCGMCLIRKADLCCKCSFCTFYPLLWGKLHLDVVQSEP